MINILNQMKESAELTAAMLDICEEDDCGVYISNLKPHVILNGENLVTDSVNICSRLVFVTNSRILSCIIELKNDTKNYPGIIDKMNNSKERAITLLHTFEVTTDQIKFLYLVITKEYPRKFITEHIKKCCKDNNIEVYFSASGKDLAEIIDSIYDDNSWKRV
jgi:hypothetical protein